MRGKKITKQKPGTAHLQPSKWQTPSSLGRHLPTRSGLCPPGDPAAPLARPRTAPPGPPPARGLSPQRAQRGAVPPHLPPARGSARDAGAQPNGGRPAPGGSKPLRAKPPLRPRSLTVRPSHDVLQERVLRRHQPSPSPGHSRSAGARRRGFAQGLAEPRSAAPLPARSARLMPPPGPWHGCAASALPPPPAHRSPAVAAAPPPDLPAAPPAGRRSAAPPRHKAGAAAPPSGSGLPNSADDCSAARRSGGPRGALPCRDGGPAASALAGRVLESPSQTESGGRNLCLSHKRVGATWDPQGGFALRARGSAPQQAARPRFTSS